MKTFFQRQESICPLYTFIFDYYYNYYLYIVLVFCTQYNCMIKLFPSIFPQHRTYFIEHDYYFLNNFLYSIIILFHESKIAWLLYKLRKIPRAWWFQTAFAFDAKSTIYKIYIIFIVFINWCLLIIIHYWNIYYNL